MPDHSTSTSTDRRAQQVCVFGLIVQLAVFAAVFGSASWLGSEALGAEYIHLAGGALIWLALLILFSQRKRARIESFEVEELRRAAEAGQSTALFETADETLHLERHRLRWMYRWFLPGFTAVLAAYHLGIYALWHFQYARPLTDSGWSKATDPSLAATFVGFCGFFCFLTSRYAAGMARQSEWRMLRAPAVYLAGNALACLLLVAAFGLELLKVSIAEPAAAYAIRILMLVLGIEFAVNLIMDAYRPRTPDEAPRPSFDSRLLALITEPGGIARSIADALNYQFGFEVSSTWFYQLLKRAFLPLVMFTFAALLALSCVVIVDADQEVIVEHYDLVNGGATLRVDLEPGLHLKWPWPIDRVYRSSVRRINSLLVGSHADEEADLAAQDEVPIEDQIILWTEKHKFSPHMMVLVATPEETDLSAGLLEESTESDIERRSRAVGVSMLMCSVAIEYRIDNLYDYLYTYQDPEKVMEAVVYQALTDFAASVDIETVIGPGREAFEQGLRAILQDRLDGLGLGVDIVFLGLQGAHPPSEDEVARAFQDVVSAEKRMEAAVQTARGEAKLIKTNTAGSVERADLLNQAIQEMEATLDSPEAGPQERAAAQERVEELLMGNLARGIRPLSGLAAAGIAEAEAAGARQLTIARSKERVFQNELAAYQAAPELYCMRKYLEVLIRAVEGIRKYVVVVDKTVTDLVIIFETEKPSLLDLAEPEPEE